LNHRVLARAFQRILASSMAVSGGALLVSCGGSSTGAPPTGAQNNGSSTADGAGGGQPDATPSQGDAESEDATMLEGSADAQGDVLTADRQVAPDSNVNSDATAGDEHSADGGSMDASVDARDDAPAVIADSSSDGDATFIVTSCGMVVSTPMIGPGGCYPACFPLEAGALAKIHAGDGGLSGSQCNSLCGTGSVIWTSCKPIDDAGVPLIQCQANCTGRRPAGLLPSPPGLGTALGVHFAEMARLEAASVDAFHHLRRELIAHRAPRRLVKAAGRAARDEIRHARMTRALARRYGGGVVMAKVEPRPVRRSLEAIAAENAVEGCVREAFGALVAHWQAAAAMDTVIRAAMTRIARDETRHAALAFEVDAWLRGRLERATKARVAAVRDRAFGELRADEAEAPEPLRSKIGLPTRSQSRFLLEQLARIAA